MTPQHAYDDDPDSWVSFDPLPDSRSCVNLGDDSGTWREASPAAEMAMYVACIAADIWERVTGRKS